MRADIVPGAIFPDYELSDHTGKHRKPHTLTEAQKEALKIVGKLVIANIELRSDLQDLRDALAREATEAAAAASPVNVEEITSRLQGVASDLQALR
jgi:hypothetical protein